MLSGTEFYTLGPKNIDAFHNDAKSLRVPAKNKSYAAWSLKYLALSRWMDYLVQLLFIFHCYLWISLFSINVFHCYLSLGFLLKKALFYLLLSPAYKKFYINIMGNSYNFVLSMFFVYFSAFMLVSIPLLLF